jgi:hypothetical protein
MNFACAMHVHILCHGYLDMTEQFGQMAKIWAEIWADLRKSGPIFRNLDANRNLDRLPKSVKTWAEISSDFDGNCVCEVQFNALSVPLW